MSPRRSAADAQQTRIRLLDTASAMASTDGLEGVSLGGLADAAQLSKSGIARHFPSKQELQLKTLEYAVDRFAEAVWRPAAQQPAGLARLRAVIHSWTDYLGGNTFPGGCFISQTSAEFDSRPGPVRDAIADAQRRWLRLLAAEARTAIDAGELAAATDADALAFQLNSLALGTNQARQLLDDAEATGRGRRLMLQLLGQRADEPPRPAA